MVKYRYGHTTRLYTATIQKNSQACFFSAPGGGKIYKFTIIAQEL